MIIWVSAHYLINCDHGFCCKFKRDTLIVIWSRAVRNISSGKSEQGLSKADQTRQHLKIILRRSCFICLIKHCIYNTIWMAHILRKAAKYRQISSVLVEGEAHLRDPFITPPEILKPPVTREMTNPDDITDFPLYKSIPIPESIPYREGQYRPPSIPLITGIKQYIQVSSHTILIFNKARLILGAPAACLFQIPTATATATMTLLAADQCLLTWVRVDTISCAIANFQLMLRFATWHTETSLDTTIKLIEVSMRFGDIYLSTWDSDTCGGTGILDWWKIDLFNI